MGPFAHDGRDRPADRIGGCAILSPERTTAAEAAEGPLHAVVVGGGFSGAVLAHQLARRAPGAVRVTVVEPRATLGGGLAYSTADPAHRINVPAARMTFTPSDPRHFERWLEADGALERDPGARLPDGRAFPARAVFGRYAAETIAPYLASGAIAHRVAAATSLRADPSGWRVGLADGGVIEADVVALAMTHPAPAAPCGLSRLVGDPRLIADTQRADALDAVDAQARVLIVGAGLTMADIVASLDRRGHRGPVVAVSRRGLLSRGHAAVAGEYGAFAEHPSASARDVVRRIRRAVAAASAEGRPWQHVLDAVRVQAPDVWAALPLAERRKIVARLRPFWDVHRFRVAPQIEAAIARMRENGQLEVLAATPIEADAGPGGIEVTVRPRGGGALRRIAADAVALATGPAHGGIVANDPLVAGAAADGHLRADPLGLGIAVDARSRALGSDGTLFVAGPLARGTFGELMGLPEVARHAEFVACGIVALAHSRMRRLQ